MLILGWHGGWNGSTDRAPPRSAGDDLMGHDAAAVLIRDGRIVAAIEEERLTRVKHSRGFPMRAIRFCLQEAGASFADLDAVVTDTSESYLDAWVQGQALEDPRRAAMSGRQWMADLFGAAFGADVESKLRFCRHHLAHVLAAVHGSGFESSLGICFDGMGDGPAGLVAECRSDAVRPLRHIPIEQSLGIFYLRSIALLGYRLFDEYKVMGLAPYGDPAVYRGVFEQLYELLPDGRYALVTEVERQAVFAEAGLARIARPKGAAFDRSHQHYAAALQEALERIALHVVEHFRRETGAERLCLSGGVAHNCSMNGVILRRRLFRDIYIQPAADDAGNVVGAALSVARETGRLADRGFMPHAFLGRDIGEEADIEARLEAWAPLVRRRRLADTPVESAQLLADGLVLGWVQGRSEFGPRALGNRSILADPRPAENKAVINAMVKKREGYRPFAPSVLEDRLHEFFDVPADVRRLPFMSIVVPVREAHRAELGAITHVDGTARVQTVSSTDNPRYHALIDAFGRNTGVPIVLNTSFNNDAEPIVDSVDDAVVCFLTTGIDRLVVGDWLVEKAADADVREQALDLALLLPPRVRLVRHRHEDGASVGFVETNGHAPAVRSAELSPSLYVLLSGAAYAGSVRARCRMAGIDPAEVRDEIFDLWQARLIELAPVVPADSAARQEAA